MGQRTNDLVESTSSSHEKQSNKLPSVWWVVLIVVIGLPAFCFRLSGPFPLTDHESLVAATAQGARYEGHWVVPHFNGQIRLQKTPLMYWAVAGLSYLSGGVDEFTVRLPSALSALACCLVIGAFGSVMFGRREGIIASLAAVGAAGILWQSHHGTADMLMTALTTGAFLALWIGLERIRRDEPATGPMLGFYVLFALANLAKGPVPAPVIGLPVAIYLVVTGQWRGWRKWRIGWGMLIVLAIVGGWVAAVLIRVPDAVWRWKAEYVQRYLGEFAGHSGRPWFYYLPQVFLLSLPWSVFLPVGVVEAFKDRSHRREMLFLMLWLVVGLVFFSGSSGKRAHYILPIIPPALLLSTIGMIRLVERLLGDRRRLAMLGLLAVLVVAVAALIGGRYAYTHWPQVWQTALAVCLLVPAGVVLWTAAAAAGQLRAATVGLTVVCCVCFALIWVAAAKLVDPASDPIAAAKMLKEKLGPGAEVYSIGRADANLIYYYGSRIPQIPNSQDIVSVVLKAKDRKQAISRLIEKVEATVEDLLRSPGRRYFITSDVRFAEAKVRARKHGIEIYEVMRIDRFFSKTKGLVVFSNRQAS